MFYWQAASACSSRTGSPTDSLSATIRRVGWLSLGSEPNVVHLFAAFKQGMLDLGWHEGKNVEYRVVYADGDVGRLNALADDLSAAERRRDRGWKPAGHPRRAAGDEDNADRDVERRQRSGRRICRELGQAGGQHHRHYQSAEETLGKLVEILHAVAPGARRMAILVNESNPLHTVFWPATQKACAALDVAALRIVANAPTQFGAAVGEIVRQRSQAVVVVPDPVYLDERAKLQELMQTTRLPVAYGWRDHVVAGGLLCYAADLAATFRHAAKYVDKILKGAKPADLPVEQPTKFDLVINMKTAKALGITIPQSLLLRADEVIQ